MDTKKEKTGNRNHDLYFSGWLRNKLKSSFDGHRVQDVDFVVWNKYQQKIMFIELKSYNNNVPPDQRLMLKKLNNWIKKGIDNDWTFYGTHLITFENSSFENGKCFLNNVEISEKDLIDFLNFK
jgi:hypothetical protein